MSLIESFITSIGTEIAKYALKLWLKDDSSPSQKSKSIADILRKHVTNFSAIRETTRQFEGIADKAGDSILQMLHKEAENISDERLIFIVTAASEAIEHTEITSELLAKNNLDPFLLTDLFLNKSGSEGGNPGLANSTNQAEQEIYVRLLNYASQMIVDTASQFPVFSEKVLGEVLSRQDQLRSIADKIMDGMNDIITSQNNSDLFDQRFESDYRMAVIRRLDHLELFGVDLSASNKRYQLSVAYVTLNVEREPIITTPSSAECTDDDNLEFRESISVNEILASTKRLLIRGFAGSGKTTLLQWISVFSAGRSLVSNLEPLNDCIPFLIRLREFSLNPLPSLEEFPKLVSPIIGGKPENWVHRVLSNGLGIVLIDGIDEAPETKRNEIKKWLDDLITQYPNSRYIVTSRPHAIDEGWLNAENFVDTTLQEMKRDDIYSFIDHWHDAIAQGLIDDHTQRSILDSLAESLKEKLRFNPSLYKLANSPLLCAILCALHRDRIENLPSDRIELYKACIEMFFRRDPERKVSMEDYIELSDRQKLDLLQDYAWWMIRNGESSSTSEETDQRFELGISRLRKPPFLADGRKVRKLFVERVGILRQFASDKIDFPHRTFQEYLAACEAHTENDIGELINHAQEDQWREVVILTAGIMTDANKAEDFISRLIAKGENGGVNIYAYYLIAASALETVVRLPENSKIIEAVSKRLHKIVPPKSIGDAKELSTAGEIVVPLLKYHHKWKADHLAASARTLALIGSDAACETICEYVSDRRSTVLTELSKTLSILSEIHAKSVIDSANINIRKRIRYISSINLQFENCSLITNLDSIGNTNYYEELEFTKCILLNDLNGLAGNQTLKRIRFLEIKVLQDLSPLTQCSNLQELSLFSSESLLDLESLHNHSTLERIFLHDCENLLDVSGLGSCPAIHNIQLTYMHNLKNLNGLGNCVSLETIKIKRCIQLSDLVHLGNSHTLQSIEIEDCQKLENITGLGQCKSLKSIKIVFCRGLKDLSDIGNNISLESVSLIGCRSIKALSSLGNCKKITSIEIIGCSSLENLHDLANCSSLHSVDCRDCEQLTNVSDLGSCNNLESLLLRKCLRLQNVNGLGNSSSLQTLDLSECENLTDISDLGKCRSLLSLHLFGCDQLSDVNTLGNCSSIEILNFYRCKQLKKISGLGNCKTLKELNLSECDKLIDLTGLGKCASLQSLYLSGCKQLTEVNDLGNCVSLQSLDLADCSQLNDVSSLGNCTLLKTLDLSGCGEMIDIHELGNCRSLETLILIGCEQLTDLSGLENCKNLKFLNISSTKIDPMSILFLKEELPELVIESIPF